jgi:BMFP domain-containing protein YqiC
MEELLKDILNELRDIKNNMVTRQDLEEKLEQKSEETKSALIEELKRVADTLETIAVGEAAVTKEKLEDKVEAGDMVLKSLIDGLENRASQRFDSLENRFDNLENRFDRLEDMTKQVLEGIKTIAENQQTTAQILSTYSDKFEKQDDLLDLINRELFDQKRKILAIRQKLEKHEEKLNKPDENAS